MLLLACAPQPLDLPGPPEPDRWTVQAEEHLPPVGLVLNEVMSANASAVMGPEGLQDWVELYNGGRDAVDLSRVGLQSGSSVWQGSGVLEAGGHLLIWDDELPFGLNSQGEELELLLDGELIEAVATGDLPDDVALLRYPDGGPWTFGLDVTPGWTNRPPTESLDASDSLFGPFHMLAVDLEVPESSLQSLEQARETKVPATATIDGVSMDVGVRLKGRWGSKRELSQKAAWKIDFNLYEPGQRFRGQEALTLNNMVQDPTYVHEFLTYGVYRSLDMPAARTGWAWLRVNGEDYGLYAAIESIDDRFLKRWWKDGSGVMYEGAYGVDFSAGEEQLFELDEGEPDDEDRSDLLAVVEALDREPSEENLAAVEGVVDVDQFLMNMAIEVNLLHWDGYTTSNNYRVYRDPRSGLFSIIPWGSDQTWVDRWYDLYQGYGRVFTWCLDVPSCRVRYEQVVVEVSDHIVAMDLAPQLTEVLAWLQPWVDRDPRREWSDEERQWEIDTTYETLADWIPALADRLR